LYRTAAAIILFAIHTNYAYGQLVITPNFNPQDLATNLGGAGVTISNFTRTGDNNSSAIFTNSGNSLGLTGGVILSTGKVANITQSANNFSSSSFSLSGDPQLQTLTTGTIYDKCILEFDIVPQGNILEFQYVFASEEYPEWVCTQFNDVFGFFISGPNPLGGNYSSYNMAKVPGSNLPVSVNTINKGTQGAYGNAANCIALTNATLFRDNLLPSINQTVVFDGMTTVLKAVASVTPCQTYHLKLAIADVADRIYDSGVLLQANSFTSVPVTITSTTELDYAGYNAAYEGCVSGKFSFSIPAPQAVDINIGISVTGTATNGVDYPAIPAVITIPAGQIKKEITVLPVEDNMAEPDETIIISTTNPCTGQQLSSASMTLKDDIAAAVMASHNIMQRTKRTTKCHRRIKLYVVACYRFKQRICCKPCC